MHDSQDTGPIRGLSQRSKHMPARGDTIPWTDLGMIMGHEGNPLCPIDVYKDMCLTAGYEGPSPDEMYGNREKAALGPSLRRTV